MIGSQSILATYDEEELPVEATASVEVDLAIFDDDDEARADQVDGVIGELSSSTRSSASMHRASASGPRSFRTADATASSCGRTSTGWAAAAFLDPHDCVVSKLVAFRDKDRAFAAALHTYFGGMPGLWGAVRQGGLRAPG